jgi:hypothetical protein
MTLLAALRTVIRNRRHPAPAEPALNMDLRTIRKLSPLALIAMFIRDVAVLLIYMFAAPTSFQQPWTFPIVMVLLFPSGVVWGVFTELGPHLDRLEVLDERELY